MTFRESMGIDYIKKRLATSSSDFLVTAYKLIRVELKKRGIIKKKPVVEKEGK
jgi:hypothetical protein